MTAPKYTGELLPAELIHARTEAFLPERAKARLKAGKTVIAGGFVAAIAWETERDRAILDSLPPWMACEVLTCTAGEYGDIDEWLEVPDATGIDELDPYAGGDEEGVARCTFRVVATSEDAAKVGLDWSPGDGTQLIVTDHPPTHEFDLACCRLELAYDRDEKRFVARRGPSADPSVTFLPCGNGFPRLTITREAKARALKYEARGYPPGARVRFASHSCW